MYSLILMFEEIDTRWCMYLVLDGNLRYNVTLKNYVTFSIEK
jgi:hypothetical protein